MLIPSLLKHVPICFKLIKLVSKFNGKNQKQENNSNTSLGSFTQADL